jgi:phospholipid/cholesterol/gamma-HCH transport system substrate-binding protein
LTVIVGAVLIVLAVNVIRRSLPGDTYVVRVQFTETKGIQTGADVRISGTRVGMLEKMTYDPSTGKAIATLRIMRATRIPDDTIFVIVSEGLIAEKYISIVFPHPISAATRFAKDDQFFTTGTYQRGLDEMMVQGNEVLEKVSNVLDTANAFLKQNDISKMVADLKAELSQTMGQANVLLARLDDLVAANQGKMTRAMTNVEAITNDVKATTAEVKKMVADENLQERIKNMTASLDKATANMAKVSDDVELIVGDPQVQQDIRDSIHQTKETLIQAKQTLQTVQSTLDRINRRVSKTKVVAGGSVVEKYVEPPKGMHSDSAFTDFNVHVGIDKAYLTTGAENIGEGGKFNLQGGYNFSKRVGARAGVYRGKVGVGMDLFPAKNGLPYFSVDMYDPNAIKFNSYLGLPLKQNKFIIVGLEDAGDQNRVVAGVGMKF